MLGGGGMGVVYKAEDLKLGRRVAIKFLPAEMASDPKAFERLEREARAASALDHPNICSIYELGEHEGQPFIVMQLLEGQTLRERIEIAGQQEEPLPRTRCSIWRCKSSTGLEAAHAEGHHPSRHQAGQHLHYQPRRSQDPGLRPGEDQSNEILPGQRSGPVKRLTETSASITPNGAFSNLRLTRTGTTVGTAHYMSPEQVRGETLDARTDLFSFGLVLYEMATGQRAFPGEHSGSGS